MADIFSPDDSQTSATPANGPRFTQAEIEGLVGGAGGQVQRIECELDGIDSVIFHRLGGLGKVKLNRFAEALFQQEFWGKVVVMPIEEAPEN